MTVTNEDVKQLCAEKYLDYVSRLKGRVSFRINEIEEQKSKLEVLGIDYESSIAQGSVTNDKVPDGVIKLIEYIDWLDADLQIYKDDMQIAIGIIESLPSDLVEPARSHYIEGVPWVTIERLTYYSHSAVMKKRKRILIEIYDLMPEEWRRILPKAV
jgi:hypothetical protein